MERKLIKDIKQERLQKVLSMLDGNYKSKDSKKNLEIAKFRLLQRDPGFDISKELYFINRGEIGKAVINFIDKNYILPTLSKLFSLFKFR